MYSPERVCCSVFWETLAPDGKHTFASVVAAKVLPSRHTLFYLSVSQSCPVGVFAWKLRVDSFGQLTRSAPGIENCHVHCVCPPQNPPPRI
jgi:hypothetical protein